MRAEASLCLIYSLLEENAELERHNAIIRHVFEVCYSLQRDSVLFDHLLFSSLATFNRKPSELGIG